VSFPTTGVIDNFNRTNEGPPPSANWDNNPSGVANDGLKVVSNAAAGNASGDSVYNESYWDVTTFGGASEAHCTISTLPSAGRSAGLFLRLQTPATAGADGYYGEYLQLAGTDEAYIYRIDNTVFTQLGLVVASQDFSAGDGFGFEAIGDTLSLYRNSGGWAQLGTSRTDATYGGAGYIGAVIEDTTGRIDNFGGGTVVSISQITATYHRRRLLNV